MIESITVDDLCNEARMVRVGSSSTVLVLEGETDRRLFSRFVSAEDVTIVVAMSKEWAAGLVGRLEAEGVRGVVAILDADFQHLEQGQVASQNILLTDYHDVEVMLLCSGAFNTLVDEYCSREKVRAYLDRVNYADLVKSA